ncbi:MAG: hypothetical protein HQ478_14580 [Chloroflexi bacterium]|nr:hypothetical protein [Chloroflexota bacterium]
MTTRWNRHSAINLFAAVWLVAIVSACAGDDGPAIGEHQAKAQLAEEIYRDQVEIYQSKIAQLTNPTLIKRERVPVRLGTGAWPATSIGGGIWEVEVTSENWVYQVFADGRPSARVRNGTRIYQTAIPRPTPTPVPTPTATPTAIPQAYAAGDAVLIMREITARESVADCIAAGKRRQIGVGVVLTFEEWICGQRFAKLRHSDGSVWWLEPKLSWGGVVFEK